MTTECFIGIDLGSTTTKAIVLDSTGARIGKGITNSRSNYDVACHIARTEALLDAQMHRYREEVTADVVLGPHAAVLTPSLERSFRYIQHMRQLESLAATCDEITAGRKDLSHIVAGMLDEMRSLAKKMFSGLAPSRKSEFFRDIAGAQFQHLAEERADARVAPYDAIVGGFDRAILRVENEPDDLGFDANARSALERSLASYKDASDAVRAAAARALDKMLTEPLTVKASVGTGYGRARLPFPKRQIRSEILCHGLGAHAMFPGTRTVLDIGGQDTKAIQLDESGIVTKFQMNDRCAAGCGRYLGYVADEMNIGVQELGPLAELSTRQVRISSTCTVFAGAELRERLSLGEKREDILAGLHRAMILRAMSLLARSGGVRDEFTFTGGVAHNPAAVRALRELVGENYGARVMNVSPDSIYTGALGGAIFALRSADETAEVVEGDAAREEAHA